MPLLDQLWIFCDGACDNVQAKEKASDQYFKTSRAKVTTKEDVGTQWLTPAHCCQVMGHAPPKNGLSLVSQSLYLSFQPRSWLKSSISLMIVMGLTWIVGVLFFNRDLLPFAYIFTILVAFQVISQDHLDNCILYIHVCLNLGSGNIRHLCTAITNGELKQFKAP